MNTPAPTSARSLARGRPGLLLITLLTGAMSISLGFVAFIASLPQIAQEFGSRGPFIAQMLVSTVALGLMVGAPVTGWILARAGTRGTLILSCVLFGLSGAGGMVLRNPNLLLASRFVMGFAEVMMTTTCFWAIGAEYERERRARAFGLVTMASNVTSIVAVMIGGVLAQIGGWRLSFVQYPIFACVTLLLVILNLRQVKPGGDGGARSRSPFFWRLLPFYLLVALLFLVLFMASTQYVFLLQADGITGATLRSIFLGGYTIVGALTGLAYGPIQKRLSMTGTIALGVTSMAAALALLGWSANPIAAAAGTVLIGFYIGILGTYVNHFVTEQTDATSRGHALGMLMTFCYLGAFLNPPVLTPLGNWIGPRNVFLLAALIMAVLAAGTLARLWLRRRSPLLTTAPGSLPAAPHDPAVPK